jgi:hypothetical protein
MNDQLAEPFRDILNRFASAEQMTFPRGDFAILTRKDEPELGRGLTCEISDYQEGGRCV